MTSDDVKVPTIGVTGHRPPRLGGYAPWVEQRLAAVADAVLEELRPARAITGMAQGWDLAIAEACIRRGTPFVAALPFPAPDSSWPPEQRERFARVLGHAERTVVHAEGPGPGVHHARDRWIVEHCDLLVALWDGAPSGGAYSTIRSAKKRKVPIHDAWSRWVALGER